VNDAIEFLVRKERVDRLTIANVGFDDARVGVGSQDRRVGSFSRRAVVVVEVVERDDRVAILYT